MTERERVKTPEYSIVIPTFNRADQLLRLLTILIPQMTRMMQEKPGELIIVDDGSKCQARERIKNDLSGQPQGFVRPFYRDENRGPSFARNYGVSQSRGKVIIFLDDDCIPESDLLSGILRQHELHPDALAMVGKIKIWKCGIFSAYWSHQYDTVFNQDVSDFYPVDGLSSGLFSIKRKLLDLTNPLFDESLPSREDYDLYLRLKKINIPVYKSDQIVVSNDCRNSLSALIRQKMWYGRGEYHIDRKYGWDRWTKKAVKGKIANQRKFLVLALILRQTSLLAYYLERSRYESFDAKTCLWMLDDFLLFGFFCRLLTRRAAAGEVHDESK